MMRGKTVHPPVMFAAARIRVFDSQETDHPDKVSEKEHQTYRYTVTISRIAKQAGS